MVTKPYLSGLREVSFANNYAFLLQGAIVWVDLSFLNA